VSYEIQGGDYRSPPQRLQPLAEALVQRVFDPFSQDIDVTKR